MHPSGIRGKTSVIRGIGISAPEEFDDNNRDVVKRALFNSKLSQLVRSTLVTASKQASETEREREREREGEREGGREGASERARERGGGRRGGEREERGRHARKCRRISVENDTHVRLIQEEDKFNTVCVCMGKESARGRVGCTFYAL
jgi:hypothetical protein